VIDLTWMTSRTVIGNVKNAVPSTQCWMVTANSVTGLCMKEMKMSKPDMILLLNDARGVFIPRDFANCWTSHDARAKNVSGVDTEQWDVLAAGPDCEPYWNVWDEVLNNAIVTADNGVKFTLYQSGDLWLIPEGMEWSDEKENFIWPEEPTGLTPEQDIDLEALEAMINRHGTDGVQAMLTVIFERKHNAKSTHGLGIEWICRRCRRQCEASETECPHCHQAH
jgi:hypothetical protein